MANKALARVASKVFISLEESAKFFPPGSTLLTGNPLRTQIVESLGSRVKGQGAENQEEAFNLLVFGGSQGAHAINVAVPEAVAQLDPAIRQNLKITHQTGEKDLQDVTAAYRSIGCEADIRPFIDDMATAYHRADLIICRAGATTIAEVTALGKVCLFVPFPHATDDHQRKNAEALLKKEACVMMLEREMNAESLANEITRLMNGRDELQRISDNARALGRLDAARLIVDEMLKGQAPCTET
jgi:UDP-N-acetylglucosamine--N-acetylmuramyl-(pentapeptide) pyrophosphoryl-undecaprenol N-acetylglucosamine transferase